jgi:DNA-binding transcriptional LysR family regulator
MEKLMNTRKVFVVDAEGKPLLPTHSARARRLLETHKAVVLQMVPFTIQLTHVVENPIGGLAVGIDDGAVTVGIAVVNEHSQEVIFSGEIVLRQDVSRLMEKRKNLRRSRRSRKTRYRQPRSHRKKGRGWLAPTILQKKDSVVRVIADLQRIMPITRCVVEQGQFDTVALAANHGLIGIDYQIPHYEGRNFRAKVLWRDHYTCQRCGSHDQLQAHHILLQSEGGSDTPENGLTLCKDCHKALHREEWIITQRPRTFIYPTHLQLGKHYLVAQLAQRGLTVTTCVGWMTSYWRDQLALPKSHVHDAIVMVSRTYSPRTWGKSYLIKPKRRKIWEHNPTKQTTERHGFRHWDLVKANHKTYGTVIGSVRSLRQDRITLRTTWNDNFPVAYAKSRVIWRFNAIIYL